MAPDGRKVGSLKQRAEPSGELRDENCTPLWREADLEVKMQKAHQLWSAFGSARFFGAKHIPKSKCAKHTTFEALLEVDVFKKGTLLKN